VSYLRTDLGYAEYVEKAYPPRSPRPQFRVDRYQIGIPSYRRQETLKEKTLAFLNRHNIDPKRVTIFVADEAEYKIYTKALQESPYNKIVIAAPGIMGVRNFMAQYYKEGTPVVFIDDDIQDLETIPFVKKAKKDEDAREELGAEENQKEQTKLEPVRNLEADVIFRGFNVKGHAGRAGLGVCRCPTIWIVDHEVAIDRGVRVLEQRLDDRQTQGEVGYEVVIHYVNMKPIGRARHALCFFGQNREISRQD
jgi:hypothetical protein